MDEALLVSKEEGYEDGYDDGIECGLEQGKAEERKDLIRKFSASH